MKKISTSTEKQKAYRTYWESRALLNVFLLKAMQTFQPCVVFGIAPHPALLYPNRVKNFRKRSCCGFLKKLKKCFLSDPLGSFHPSLDAFLADVRNAVIPEIVIPGETSSSNVANQFSYCNFPCRDGSELFFHSNSISQYFSLYVSPPKDSSHVPDLRT